MKETKKTTQSRDIKAEAQLKPAEKKPPTEKNERLVREYYEAESWQFSGCGD